jgi:TonB-dependent receptor
MALDADKNTRGKARERRIGMRDGSGRTLRGWLCLGTGLSLFAAVHAEALPGAEVKTFDIPSQPAQEGISQFVSQADVQLLVSQRLTRGRQTGAVQGAMTVREGLNRLLAGTGLIAVPQPNGSIVLADIAARPEPPLVVVRGTGSVLMAQKEDSAIDAAAGVQAQQVAQPPIEIDNTVIVITGTRVSQRSAIDRKKTARTITDSIVAEDVGSFPDKNIGEAISRLPGVQLDRGDFGEGVSVTLRGSGPETTRVEIDGLGVQNTNGGMAFGAGAARGAEFRDLPSDLIMSVDVIKGSTAAMTEGSLGGSIKIQSRTSLDFSKPYLALRIDGQRNSLGEKVTPEYNLIASRKFLGNRLGVLLNVSGAEVQTNSDKIQVGASGTAGYARGADFDNSPDKTFSFNPSTVDPTAITPLLTEPLVAGGNLAFESPVSLVSKSAAAKSKADCYTLFPALTAAQLNAIVPGAGGVNQNVARDQRANELQTCLNQWNDYTPSLIRYSPWAFNEKRFAADLRVDYKVSQDFSVFAKVSVANRDVDSFENNLSLGSPSFNLPSAFSQSLTPGVDNFTTAARTVNPATGYYYAYGNDIVDIVPDSTLKIDSAHHVTQFTLSDGTMGLDASRYQTHSHSRYLSAGGTYSKGPVRLEFLFGDAANSYSKNAIRAATNFVFGRVRANVLPSGLWTYALPSNIQMYDAAAYAQVYAPSAALGAVPATNAQPAVSAFTVDNQANFSTPINVTYRPALADGHERSAKVDLTYRFADGTPFIADVAGGLQTRSSSGDGWGGGGYQVRAGTGIVGAADYVAPIVVPTNNLTRTIRACTPNSNLAPSGPVQPCVYGYLAGTLPVNGVATPNLSDALFGTLTVTPGDLTAMIGQSLYPLPHSFLNGFPGRGNILSSWPLLDTAKLADLAGVGPFDFNCMKLCKANDGQVYEQPHSAYTEHTNALYLMVDFRQALPFGMVLDGNAGTRFIHTRTRATGVMTLNHIARTAAFNPASPFSDPGAATSLQLNTVLNGESKDWTPSYTVSLWLKPDVLRLTYYSGHVIARPPVNTLLPAGTCNLDDRIDGVIDADGSPADSGCSGRVGNPSLKPYKAINHNEAIEWYIDKDSMVSLGYYYNNVRVGAPIAANASNVAIFAGSSAVDPVTGASLHDLSFSYPTYVNGPSGLQRGIEFQVKLAFTWLPGLLKYTGTDFNYSKLGSKNFQTIRDLNSGDALPPQFQADYFENWSVWYDDGRLNARIAYQARGSYFDCIASCNVNTLVNDYPAAGLTVGQRVAVPYNPGGSNFRDKSAFIDARVNYKLTSHVELFLEGRNIGRVGTSESQGPYGRFADGTPNIEYVNYSGARYLAGATFRY